MASAAELVAGNTKTSYYFAPAKWPRGRNVTTLSTCAPKIHPPLHFSVRAKDTYERVRRSISSMCAFEFGGFLCWLVFAMKCNTRRRQTNNTVRVKERERAIAQLSHSIIKLTFPHTRETYRRTSLTLPRQKQQQCTTFPAVFL